MSYPRRILLQRQVVAGSREGAGDSGGERRRVDIHDSLQRALLQAYICSIETNPGAQVRVLCV